MVVIAIIGILAAIAVPTFLQQGRRGYITEMQRSTQFIYDGQAQAYVNDGIFYDSFDELSAEGYLSFAESPTGLSNEGSSDNYIYTITSAGEDEALIQITPRDGASLPTGAARLWVDDRQAIRSLLCTDAEGDPIPSLAGLEQCPG